MRSPSSVGEVDARLPSFFRRPLRHSVGLAVFKGLGQLPFRAKWKLAELLCSNSLRRDKVLIEVLSKNLSACLPDWSDEAINKLAFTNTQETFFALIDRFRVWALTQACVRDQVTLANAHLLHQHVGKRPVVLLLPHFLGIEAAYQRLTLEVSSMTLYRPSDGDAFESLRASARQRFGQQHLYRTDASMLPMIRRLRGGTPLVLLPDLDCGAPSAVFSRFFGIEAATAPLTAWCALNANAVVLPMSVCRGHEGRYTVTIHEAMAALSPDITQATGEVNSVIEQMVRRQPEHYWWGQPRFATRPPGAPDFYSDEVLAYARHAFGSAV